MDSHSTIEFVLDLPKYVETKEVFTQCAVLYPFQ
jgi:hypothetical protein